MILLKDVLNIHKILVEQFGGLEGVRDIALLESAIARPYASFDGIDLYPSIEEKAASLIESILVNHPFLDGNKRTGYVLLRLLLMQNSKDLNASEDEKYDFVISIAEGKIQFALILDWIRKHTIEL